MAVESPVNVAVLSRLPQPVLNTAAFSMLMALSLWIESPVIDLLSTSTTLSKDRKTFLAIREFSVGMMVFASGMHALIALTPLYWFVTVTLFRFPVEVASHARIGMMLMIPWSACIGWRRHLQGILIRYGQTRLIGIGTTVRVGTMTLTAVTLFLTVQLAGTVIAGIALVTGVFCEAAFAHWASQGSIAQHLQTDRADVAPIALRKLLSFHLPLTLTTMVNLSTLLLVAAAVAHTPHPVLGLAALQVAQTLLWLCRTSIFALPEVVITLARDAASTMALRRFCLNAGFIASGALLFLWVTGLDRLFFARILGATEAETALAHLAFIAPAATPFIGALQCYLRGVLTLHHSTVARLYAILVGLAALLIGLMIGIRTSLEGVVTAGLALTVAMLAELGVLTWFWQRHDGNEHSTMARRLREEAEVAA